MTDQHDFFAMLFAIGYAKANGMNIQELAELCTNRPDIKTADDFAMAVETFCKVKGIANRG